MSKKSSANPFGRINSPPGNLKASRNAGEPTSELPSRRALLISAATHCAIAGAGALGGVRWARAQTNASSKKSVSTPQDFGAIGDGLANDSSAFQSLAATPGAYIRVPQGRYLIKETISILERQVWQFENAELLYEGKGAMFQAIAVNDWAMLGLARLQGPRTPSIANVGLVVNACRRFRVSHLQFSKFNGVGLVLSGDTVYLHPRGDRGQFSDLGFVECTTAIDIQASAASEYNIFSNTVVTACGKGIVIAAGNCQFVGGNVVDCGIGVTLLPGRNHGHGGFHGFNLNHATQYNLYADAIETGYTFNGCHFYGDGGLKGAIYLKNSKGILIQGGQIDCAVINDGKAGKNFVLNNTVPGNSFKILSNAGDAAGVVCRNAMRFDGSDACT